MIIVKVKPNVVTKLKLSIRPAATQGALFEYGHETAGRIAVSIMAKIVRKCRIKGLKALS